MNRIQKWSKLCGLLDRIVLEIIGDDEELIKEVLDRHKKSQRVAQARGQILRVVRNEIWELNNHNSPDWEVVRSSVAPSKLWKPLGYISISRILGGDHSAWVKMASNLRSADASTAA